MEAIDLHELQEEIEAAAGIPVDLYLISPEKQVLRTTYPPDQDLDFTHPALLDGRTLIRRAHEQEDIVVGAPVLEVVAREFRIYSYSPLGETDYTLELGFVPPDLNRYFDDMEEQLSERELFDVRLHYLMWDDWVLSLHPDRREAEDKQALLQAHYDRQEAKLRYARKAGEAREPVRAEDQGTPTYFLHLMEVPAEGALDLDVLAEVVVDTDMVARIRDGLVTAALVTLAVLALAGVALFVLIRQALARPLYDVARSMERWEPSTLHGGGRAIRELQVLASHYNGMLDRTRTTIEGLGREAHTDALTGLANRAQLETELAVEVRRSTRYGTGLSLVFLDIDHFKEINDLHGHLTGDQILRGIADLVAGRTRSADTVGRWGGEEFLIICRETSRADAVAVATSLRLAIAEAEFVEGLRCTASFGVAGYRAGDAAETLFARCDRALYRAKKRGRNRVEEEDATA